MQVPADRRILVVEDDDTIRELVNVVVRRCGYLATTVANGGEAIAAIGRESFCAVLLDLMMPEISGYDVIMHIRQSALSLPVIVITAAVRTLDHAMLDPAIVRQVVTKPFDIDQITSALEAVCPPEQPLAAQA
jgi:CheY-like chemotaxis protein